MRTMRSPISIWELATGAWGRSGLHANFNLILISINAQYDDIWTLSLMFRDANKVSDCANIWYQLKLWNMHIFGPRAKMPPLLFLFPEYWRNTTKESQCTSLVWKAEVLTVCTLFPLFRTESLFKDHRNVFFKCHRSLWYS